MWSYWRYTHFFEAMLLEPMTIRCANTQRRRWCGDPGFSADRRSSTYNGHETTIVGLESELESVASPVGIIPQDQNSRHYSGFQTPTSTTLFWLSQQHCLEEVGCIANMTTWSAPTRLSCPDRCRGVRIKETRRALAIALDGNGRYCAANPRQGAKLVCRIGA